MFVALALLGACEKHEVVDQPDVDKGEVGEVIEGETSDYVLPDVLYASISGNENDGDRAEYLHTAVFLMLFFGRRNSHTARNTDIHTQCHDENGIESDWNVHVRKEYLKVAENNHAKHPRDDG